MDHHPFSLSSAKLTTNKVYAEESVDLEGSSIGMGSRSIRLLFGSDARFSIAVKDKIWEGNAPELTGLDKCFFVPLKIGEGRTVYANIESLASRLGITKKEIKEQAELNDGSLERLIDKRLIYQKEILECYHNLFSYYEQSESKMQKEGLITKPLLMKVIREAVEHFQESTDETKELHYEGHNVSYILRKNNQERKIEIIAKRLIGMGGFGKVYETVFVGSQTGLALKLARIEFSEDGLDSEDLEKRKGCALDSIEEEYGTLKIIHSRLKDKQVRGIQEEPYEIIIIKKANGEIVKGFLGKKYDGPLSRCFDEGTGSKLQLINDLLSGLFYLNLASFIHHDLKIENVLIKKNEGVYSAFIADLAGATDILTVESNWHKTSMGTKAYTHRMLLYAMMKACEAYKKCLKEEENLNGIVSSEHLKKKEDAFKSFVAAGRRNDLFALGIICFELLTKGYAKPFSLTNKGFPDLQYKTEKIREEKVKESLILDFSLFPYNLPIKYKNLIFKLLDVKNYPKLTINDLIDFQSFK